MTNEDDKPVIIAVRIPASVRREVKAMAATNDTSIQEIVRTLLEKWIEERRAA